MNDLTTTVQFTVKITFVHDHPFDELSLALLKNSLEAELVWSVLNTGITPDKVDGYATKVEVYGGYTIAD